MEECMKRGEYFIDNSFFGMKIFSVVTLFYYYDNLKITLIEL